jgi:hypothetical protein
MNTSQMSVENVKEIILKFPDEDKMKLLRVPLLPTTYYLLIH